MLYVLYVYVYNMYIYIHTHWKRLQSGFQSLCWVKQAEMSAQCEISGNLLQQNIAC